MVHWMYFGRIVTQKTIVPRCCTATHTLYLHTLPTPPLNPISLWPLWPPSSPQVLYCHSHALFTHPTNTSSQPHFIMTVRTPFILSGVVLPLTHSIYTPYQHLLSTPFHLFRFCTASRTLKSTHPINAPSHPYFIMKPSPFQGKAMPTKYNSSLKSWAIALNKIWALN